MLYSWKGEWFNTALELDEVDFIECKLYKQSGGKV